MTNIMNLVAIVLTLAALAVRCCHCDLLRHHCGGIERS